MQTTRPTSIFDLIADDRLYNQDLSSILLTFNPIYSNILPFGDATPNRNGVYFNGNLLIDDSDLNSQYFFIIGLPSSGEDYFTVHT